MIRDEAVLLYADKRRDARLAAEFLREAGFDVRHHATMESLLRELVRAGAGAIVLTQEGVTEAGFQALEDWLVSQAAWSDLPVIMFVPGKRSPMVQKLAGNGNNVTTLDRPVMISTLVTALKSALRSRHKQYELRDVLEGHERVTSRLKEQDRRKDQFLAMLGHELRNPLSAIHNALYLSQRADSLGTMRDACAIIDRQSRHLTRLVNDLLDVSRVTLGRIALERRPVDLREIASRCVTTFDPEAANRRITIALVARPEPLVVNGDAVRLEQVLANLVTNAIKFTPEGGRITVAVAREGTKAVIRVRDTGIGIDPQLMPTLFDLFEQGAQPLDRHRGGLGLGLTLARSLLERQGGSIEALSEGAGRGSEFVVRLPLIEAPAFVAHEDIPSAEPCRELGLRVLVIEDNDDARETLRRMLELWGCEVATASDGAEGLDKLLSLHPRFAIIDIGLPTLDGYAVARRVRASAGGHDIKLIALTGYGQPDDAVRARSAGFDVHLTKPVRESELAAHLSTPATNGH